MPVFKLYVYCIAEDFDGCILERNWGVGGHLRGGGGGLEG